MTTFAKYETAFILTSERNPSNLLTTGNELVSKRFIGPGTRKSAKFFKTKAGAERRAKGSGMVVKQVSYPYCVPKEELGIWQREQATGKPFQLYPEAIV